MKRYSVLIIALFIGHFAHAETDTLQLIKLLEERYINYHLNKDDELNKIQNIIQDLPKDNQIGDRVNVELFQRIIQPDNVIERLARTMNNDGSWNDIDYASKNRSGWFPKEHPERLLILAKAFIRLREEKKTELGGFG
jgi:hypothetical protein